MLVILSKKTFVNGQLICHKIEEHIVSKPEVKVRTQGGK
jgi:hypothetical protein